MNLKQIKILWDVLIGPIFLSIVISASVWVSVFWYLDNNLENAIIALAFGVFMFFMKDLLFQTSNQKETS